MRSFLRVLAPSLLALGLAAGEPAPPSVTLRVADGAELVKAWDASILAKVWTDPATAPLRAKWAEGITEATTELGFDPIAVLHGMRGLEARFHGMAGAEQPQIHLRVDLGPLAAPVFKRIAASDNDKLKPQQVAGADEAIGSDKGSIARFGTVLAIAMAVPFAPAAPAAPAGASPAAVAMDIDAKLLMATIAASVPEDQRAQWENIQTNLQPYLGTWTYRGDLLPEGIRERLDGDVPSPGSAPVDRSLLARLPASTLMTLAWGFDGKAYWQVAKDSLLAQLDEALHPGAPVGPAATAEAVQAAMRGMGIPGTLEDAVIGLTGSGLIAITQSMPFPAATIALPRSPVMDQLLSIGLSQIGNAVPEEGQSSPIALPGMDIPVQITLVRDRAHWVITSDAVLAATWTSGAAGGFADTPMAKTLYAAAPQGASVLGASDTPAVLRTIQGFLGMALAFNDELSQEEKQSINGAIIRLSAMAKTGYIWQSSETTRTRSEVRGLVGSGLVPGFIAAAVFGSLTARQVGEFDDEGFVDDTPEGAAVETLSSVLFPAQFQFQGGVYLDQDKDGIGEFGTLAELTGRAAAPGRAQPEALADGFAEDGSRGGFRFQVFLPDAAGKALGAIDKPRKVDQAAADAQEQAFVIYAWPVDEGSGSRMFAVDQSGVVFEAPFTGKAPTWNALYGGQGWDGIPAWQPAQR